MKKAVSFALVFMLILSCSAPALATTSAIDSIDSLVIDMYKDAESAPQQTSAVAFGSMYMLNFIVRDVCTSQSRIDAISDIVSKITDSVQSVDGAPQVSALSLYGCVYELCAIAYEKDRFGLYNDIIKSVTDGLSNTDTSSAVQEMALASYRMVDALSIIALEVGCSSDKVSSINDRLKTNNAGLSGAPQQTANGLYRSAELLYLIAAQDCSSYTSGRVYDLLDGMYEDNDSCKSAVQQTSNGMTTIYMMLRAIAYDKA